MAKSTIKLARWVCGVQRAGSLVRVQIWKITVRRAMDKQMFVFKSQKKERCPERLTPGRFSSHIEMLFASKPLQTFCLSLGYSSDIY